MAFNRSFLENWAAIMLFCSFKGRFQGRSACRASEVFPPLKMLIFAPVFCSVVVTQ